MNLAYHDAKYADLYEETLYNALLGSIDLEGKNFYYQNPLDSAAPATPWHVCPCCVGNIPRTLLMMPTWTYVKGDDGLYVNLFIGSTIKVENVAGTDVRDGPEDRLSLERRRLDHRQSRGSRRNSPSESACPNRGVSELYTARPIADGITSISVNGSAIAPTIEKGYAVITRPGRPATRSR